MRGSSWKPSAIHIHGFSIIFLIVLRTLELVSKKSAACFHLISFLKFSFLFSVSLFSLFPVSSEIQTYLRSSQKKTYRTYVIQSDPTVFMMEHL